MEVERGSLPDRESFSSQLESNLRPNVSEPGVPHNTGSMIG
jgi:hypothetical protein